jgi:hypothetical protein
MLSLFLSLAPGYQPHLPDQHIFPISNLFPISNIFPIVPGHGAHHGPDVV